MTDVHELVTVAEKTHRTHPEWRRGQAYFNTLLRHRPDLARQVHTTAADPFYDDDRITLFLDVVEGLWIEET